MSDEPTVTLTLPRERCVVDDDTVRFTLPVERWEAWLPAFQAALDGGLVPMSLGVCGGDG